MFTMLTNMIRDTNGEFGEFLKALRTALALTLREVGERSGVSHAFLSQLESGKVKEPSPVILYKLASVYGVAYEVLMRKAGYPAQRSSPVSGDEKKGVLRRLGNLSEQEEMALLEYLAFIRSRDKSRGSRR